MNSIVNSKVNRKDEDDDIQVYKRPWVRLTDEEIYRIAFELEGEHWKKIADAIEAMNTFVGEYDTGSLKIHTPQPSIGGYRMGDEANGGWILFSLPKKPCWAHRMGVWLVLGWKWVDA